MHKRLFLLSAIAFTIVLCACSSDNGSDVSVIPEEVAAPYRITPQDAWEGLQWSLDAQKSVGWLEAIGTTFQYLPDPESAERYPNAFSSWDRDVEIGFIQELFLADLEFHAKMLPVGFEQPNPAGADVSWQSVEYSVRVEGRGGVSPVAFSGVANLEFRLEGNFWYLVSWEDISGVAAPWNANLILPTFGELRAVFRSE
jgi:hypothetical protein